MSGRSGARSSVVSNSNSNSSNGNRSKRECAGCEGSRVILPALLLTLDEYSSWRLGRVVPMIAQLFHNFPLKENCILLLF